MRFMKFHVSRVAVLLRVALMTNPMVAIARFGLWMDYARESKLPDCRKQAHTEATPA